MPTTLDTSQETALRLQRAIDTANLVPPDSSYQVITPNGGNVFEISTALDTAYQADLLLPDPSMPACRSANPCYSALCTDTMQSEPSVFELPVEYSVKITVNGYQATIVVSDGPPNADYMFDWGDSTSVPMLLDSNGDWTASHTYAMPGSFTLAVNDDDGVVATKTIPVPSS